VKQLGLVLLGLALLLGVPSVAMADRDLDASGNERFDFDDDESAAAAPAAKSAGVAVEGWDALAADGTTGRALSLVGHNYDSSLSFVAPRTAGLADEVVSSSRYTRTSFGGNRVYQRNDLIGASLVDARGRTNLERMQRGLAPIGPDGQSINLHHLTQRQSGAIAEVTATMHQQNSGILHINPASMGSTGLRSTLGEVTTGERELVISEAVSGVDG